MDASRICYIVLLLGLCLWQYPSVHWISCMMKTRLHITRNLGRLTDRDDLHRYGKISGHIKLMIEGAEANRLFPTVNSFFWMSGILSISGMMAIHIVTGAELAMTGGIFIAVLPYLSLQVRLHEKRVERSKEGDLLVQELLNHYQIHDYNMQEAILQTAENLNDAPLGKRVYMELAKGLQHAVTKTEVEEVLRTFRYAFHTAWGNVLASNIFFAHLYGIRVDASLKDLLFCMTESRKSMEYSRRENHEARMMLMYIAPISYILSILFACRYFDFTLRKFLSYQFGTTLGMQWFLTMVLFYAMSLVIHKFLAKEKMDL